MNWKIPTHVNYQANLCIHNAYICAADVVHLQCKNIIPSMKSTKSILLLKDTNKVWKINMIVVIATRRTRKMLWNHCELNDPSSPLQWASCTRASVCSHVPGSELPSRVHEKAAIRSTVSFCLSSFDLIFPFLLCRNCSTNFVSFIMCSNGRGPYLGELKTPAHWV